MGGGLSASKYVDYLAAELGSRLSHLVQGHHPTGIERIPVLDAFLALDAKRPLARLWIFDHQNMLALHVTIQGARLRTAHIRRGPR